MTTTNPAPGWYPDQSNGALDRFWDGNTWVGEGRPRGAVPIFTHTPIPPQLRQEALGQAIMRRASQGYRLVSQYGYGAVVEKDPHVNHAVHAILSIITLGLWLPVWLIISLSAKRTKIMLTVDEYGRVSESFGIPQVAAHR